MTQISDLFSAATSEECGKWNWARINLQLILQSISLNRWMSLHVFHVFHVYFVFVKWKVHCIVLYHLQLPTVFLLKSWKQLPNKQCEWCKCVSFCETKCNKKLWCVVRLGGRHHSHGPAGPQITEKFIEWHLECTSSGAQCSTQITGRIGPVNYHGIRETQGRVQLQCYGLQEEVP